MTNVLSGKPELTNEKQSTVDHRTVSAGLCSSDIPTSDPDAALRFCRALAASVQNGETSPAVAALNGTLPTRLLAHTRGYPLPEPLIDLSVVLPVYNEESNITELYDRLTRVLQRTELHYEIIFVNDGSRDASLEQLQMLAAQDEHILVIELARNFGHQVALSAGLEYTRGRGVVVMDSDLQDPPEVLPAFIERWQAGYEVVYAIREKRKEFILKRIAYALFYRILQRVAHVAIPIDSGDFCIMDRCVVDLLVSMPERNRFVRGIRSWVGFRQVGLAYERQARHAGKPKYTFSRLMGLALDGIISFSYMPLRAITLIGLGVSVFSIALAAFYFWRQVLFGLNPPGFPTLIVAIFFLSGIQLITLGMMGEYVGRIFEEIKHRPLYTVRRVFGHRQGEYREEQAYAHLNVE
jgi:dolichol-phosphate mannosyltransferase